METVISFIIISNLKCHLCHQSYLHYHEHRAAVEVNLGCCRYPAPEQLTEVWRQAHQALKSLILEVSHIIFDVLVTHLGNKKQQLDVKMDSHHT